MKKLLSFVLVAAFALAFTACGNQAKEETTATEATEEVVEEAEEAVEEVEESVEEVADSTATEEVVEEGTESEEGAE